MPVQVVAGESPIIICLPYAGSAVPRLILSRLNDTGRALDGTDAYLDRVAGALDQDVTIVAAKFHRFVSDPEAADTMKSNGAVPGMIGVVPLHNSDRKDIWAAPPSPTEASMWRSLYYAPFHAALRAQAARVRAQNRFVLVVSLHSFREDIGDASCDIRVSTSMTGTEALAMSTGFTRAIQRAGSYICQQQGNFDSGRITRSFGKPERRSHALQISLNQALFLSQWPEPESFASQGALRLSAAISYAMAETLSAIAPN